MLVTFFIYQRATSNEPGCIGGFEHSHGMTNAWLAEQGVISLKALWVNIHYPDGGKRRQKK